MTSAIVLCFMILEARGYQVTDLFALAVKSSASGRLRGACWAEPVGGQLAERWVVGMEEVDAHYYIREKGYAGGAGGAGAGDGRGRGRGNGRGNGYRRLDMEVENGSGKVGSPAVDEFRWVSRRRSWFTRFYGLISGWECIIVYCCFWVVVRLMISMGPLLVAYNKHEPYRLQH